MRCVIMALAILCLVVSSRAGTVSYKKVKKDGNMTWVGSETVPCWKDKELNCLRTPPPDGDFTVEPFAGGYLLTTTVSHMTAWRLSSPDDVRTVSSSDHTFDDSIEIRIESCPEYPFLVGRQINIGGLSTATNSQLRVFIP